MRPVAALLLWLVCGATAAHALSDAEHELLVRSLRPSEAKKVTRELGGLASLSMKSLDLELFPDDRRLEGQARLEWTNTTGKALETLYVRLSAHAGTDRAPSVAWSEVTASIDGAPAQSVALTPHSTTIRSIALPKKLAAGKRVVLQGKLSGRLAHVARKDTELLNAGAQAMGGGPRAAPSQYGTFACGMGICTLTGFAPEVPAFIDGRFDLAEGSGIGDATYSEPSNVLLSVVVPASAQVAATGLVVGKVPEPDDRRRWMFVMAGAREVGFVSSSDFVLDEATVNGVHVLSYSLTRDRENGKRALKAATTSLEAFDKAFGRYPWAELTIAQSALVGGAGGVELPGLALGAAGLYATESSGAAGPLAAFEELARGMQTEMLDFVIRHEVAHQWWHAQVGTHAQRHPWLDEPLAQWSALYSTRVTSGPEAAKRARQLQVELNFHGHRLMGGKDGKAARAAGDFDDQFQYAALIYGKAPLFYAALEKEIGQKKLLSALRSYASRYRFERAQPRDLEAHLVTAAGDKGPRVAALWQRWFHQTRGAADLGEPDLMKIFGLLSPAGPGGASGDDRVTPDRSLDMLRGLLDGLE